MPRGRPGEPAALADEPPPARLRGDARRAAGRRPASSTRRWAAGRSTLTDGPSAARRTRLRLHRPPEPARRCSAPSTSPTPTCTSPQRSATTVPQQALFLMNSPFVARAGPAPGRADRDGADAATSASAQLYRLAYQRDADRRRSSSRARTSSTPRPASRPPPPPEPPRLAVRLRRVRRGDAAASPTSSRCRTSPARPGRAAPSWPDADARLGPTHRRRRPRRATTCQHAAVRRWTAPARRRGRDLAARSTTTPTRATASAAAIVSSRQGDARHWHAVHNAQGRARRRRARGRSRATRSTSSSTVGERPQQRPVHLGADDPRSVDADAETDAGTPQPTSPARRDRRRSTPWEQLAQVLLLTNEFMFVD